LLGRWSFFAVWSLYLQLLLHLLPHQRRTTKEPRLQNPDPTPAATPTPQLPETREEARLIRRLQLMMNLVLQTIAQDPTLTIDDASQMIADARSAALAMFPGKELAYDLIWRPRFQRLLRERFRIM
jgi:hypothetical protein